MAKRAFTERLYPPFLTIAKCYLVLSPEDRQAILSQLLALGRKYGGRTQVTVEEFIAGLLLAGLSVDAATHRKEGN